MQIFTTTLALLLASSPLLQAAALSSQFITPRQERQMFVEGKQATHHLAFIDLTDGVPTGTPDYGNATATTVQPRQGIRYCISDTARAGVCVAVSGIIGQIGTGIAGVVKGKSDKHDCSAVDGTVARANYRVYATGRNCDTTAQLGTIAGAIDKYLRDVDSEICGTHCIQLTHGGTWTGYVVLAPAGTEVDSFYCGSAYKFGSCATGGKNDNHN